MNPRFIPVKDLNGNSVCSGSSMKGVQPYHRDWGSLYKDQSVGDSLANTVRHWNEECAVDVPFLIIGGRESIAATLLHDPLVRFASPFGEGGVAALATKSREGTFSKSYTIVLVMPAAYCSTGKPIENLSRLGMMVNLLKDTNSGETLSNFREKWSLFAALDRRYGV